MHRVVSPLLAALATSLVAGAAATMSPAHADVLLIERVESEQAVPLPARGSTMAQVEARFGAPTEKRAPVGGYKPQHPPITRWVYPEFSVYFEHDKVVDAVVNRMTAYETGPKPIR